MTTAGTGPQGPDAATGSRLSYRTPLLGDGATARVYRVASDLAAKVIAPTFLDTVSSDPRERESISEQILSYEHRIARTLRECGVRAVRTYGLARTLVRTSVFGLGRAITRPALVMDLVQGVMLERLPANVREHAGSLLERELDKARSCGFTPSWTAARPEGNAFYDLRSDNVTLLDFAFWDEPSSKRAVSSNER